MAKDQGATDGHVHDMTYEAHDISAQSLGNAESVVSFALGSG